MSQSAPRFEPVEVKPKFGLMFANTFLGLFSLGIVGSFLLRDEPVARTVIAIYSAVVFVIFSFLFLRFHPTSMIIDEEQVLVTTPCKRCSLSHAAITTVEYTPRLRSYFGPGRGMFTSNMDGFYFKTDDPRDNIKFTPDDPQLLISLLQRSPLAGKLIIGEE